MRFATGLVVRLLVGLTTTDLSTLRHKSVQVSSSSSAVVLASTNSSPLTQSSTSGRKIFAMTPGKPCSVSVAGNTLKVAGVGEQLSPGTVLEIVPAKESAALDIDSLRRNGKKPQYHGRLIILPDGDHLRIVLVTNLETYIEGVLESEIPASYDLEAIKAQAVTARTYALHPRIDHTDDNCNVCDSFLCCQYFAELDFVSPKHKQAIAATKGQILSYSEKPILALFSSSAGGHTEDYENCFSDPKTGAFPPPPLPYLKGVAEGKLPPGYTSDGVTEQAMRALWAESAPQTYDGWASQFKWSANISADLLESHMHHTVATMLDDKDQSRFIEPPESKTFGHIHAFKVGKRGVAGTAIELSVETSTGTWKFQKELVIRSIFKLPELKLGRLRSARVFFDHHYDKLGLLSSVEIRGLGFGHGVGLQQTGAQGMAKQGKTYKEIVAHYFKGIEILTV